MVEDLVTTLATERGPIRAVDGVSFVLNAGETLGIVGESGSGKTVLSRSILGLLPRRARVEGSIRFEGIEMVGAPASVRRSALGRGMGVVLQNPMTALNPVMRIGAQVIEPLRYHLRMGRDQAHARGVDLLTLVGVPDAAGRMSAYPHELSGGLRQRVTIAIALACDPRLLVADEPTTALDVTVQAQILDLLSGAGAERDMAMILITHDLGVVATRTDRIAVMYAGRIVEDAPTSELFSSPRMPYTKGLMDSIPTWDHSTHNRLAAIAGRPPDLALPPPGCRFAPRCAYVREQCTSVSPILEGDPGWHRFACWYPLAAARP